MTEGYTPKKCELDRHHIIEHALLFGQVTHSDAERFEPKCTVIRSRVPEIRYQLGWPIKNTQSRKTFAIYSIDVAELAQRACCSASLVRLAAKDWVASGRLFGPVFPFLEFLGQGYRVLQPIAEPEKNPAADPGARAIFKKTPKIKRQEAQGELWAY